MKNRLALTVLYCCSSALGITRTSATTLPPDKGVSSTAAKAKADADAKTAAGPKAAPTYGFWVTYLAMGALLIVMALAILRGLRKWSLSEAL